MKSPKGILSGKKTYVTAIVGILTALGGYLVGDTDLRTALQVAWNGILAITIRHGIASK